MKWSAGVKFKMLSGILPPLLAMLVACDVPFSPKGEYAEKVVVYSVLDPRNSVHFARVYFTFNVEGVDPQQNTVDPQVRNARVEIRDDRGNTYTLRDTLLRRDSRERYASDIVAYYTDRLVASVGKSYTLEITVPQYGKASAAVTVPEPFIIYVNGSRLRPVLDDSTNLCNCIPISLFGGKGAKGHLTRMFIDYTIKKGNETVALRREVPMSRRQTLDGSMVLVYPQPDRSPYMEFPKSLFLSTMSDILKSDPSAEVVVERVTVFSYAMEPSLYNYYLIAHGFADPLSVRLDLPDFTNVQNGLGVFGAVATDSLSLPLR